MLHHTAPCCITLHHVATHCSTSHYITLQHTATHCTTLQHTTSHYISLQNTATHCNTLQHTATHCTQTNCNTRKPEVPPRHRWREYHLNGVIIRIITHENYLFHRCIYIYDWVRSLLHNMRTSPVSTVYIYERGRYPHHNT